MMRYPYLVPGARWEEEHPGSYLLSHPERPDRLRMGRLERWIVAALDGHTPPSEIARNLAMALGQPIGEGSMNAVLSRLAEQGFVVVPPRPRIEVLPEARARCFCSSHCCHLAVGPLSPLEQKRLSSLPWAELGQAPPEGEIFTEHEGKVFLRQREDDSSCLFLQPDGLCRLHRVFGYHVKPAICRLFPVFTVDIGGGRLRAGVCYECGGAAQAGPECKLSADVAQAGELLFATRLAAGPPTLLGGEQIDEPVSDRGEEAGQGRGQEQDREQDQEQGLEREQEMLALLGSWGSNVAEALVECSRRLCDDLSDGAPDGFSAGDWLAELCLLAQELLERTISPYYRKRLAALHALLTRGAELLATPPAEAAGSLPWAEAAAHDELLRRVWRNYVFTRHHFFRFGQVPGLALLMLAHLLFMLLLRDAAASGEASVAGLPLHERAGRLLPRVLDVGRLLEQVSSFPGVGRRVLLELGGVLVATPVRGSGPPEPRQGGDR